MSLYLITTQYFGKWHDDLENKMGATRKRVELAAKQEVNIVPHFDPDDQLLRDKKRADRDDLSSSVHTYDEDHGIWNLKEQVKLHEPYDLPDDIKPYLRPLIVEEEPEDFDLEFMYGLQHHLGIIKDEEPILPFVEPYLPFKCCLFDLRTGVFMISAYRFVSFLMVMILLVELEDSVTSEEQHNCPTCLRSFTVSVVILINQGILICQGLVSGLPRNNTRALGKVIILHLFAFLTSVCIAGFVITIVGNNPRNTTTLCLAASFFLLNGIGYLIFGYIIFAYWWRLKYRRKTLNRTKSRGRRK